MKRTYKIFTPFIFMLLLVGCSEDFLDKQPTDALSSGTFWTSASDAKIALAGVYGRMQAQYLSTSTFNRWTGPRMFMAWDCMTDNAYMTFNTGFRALTDGTANPSSEDVIEDLYGICYEGIGACNLFLDNIDNVNGLSTDEMNAMKGEVYFIRGYWYYYLAATYGDVPLRLETPTLDNQNIAKSTQEQVFAHIVSDADMAISLLPAKNYDDGHIGRPAAQALKARVLLYQMKDFDVAASLTNEIIQSDLHSLSDDYPGLFLDGSQENNPEIIFSIKHTNVAGESQRHSVQVVAGFWGSVQLNRVLVDAYEATDGLHIDNSPLYDSVNPMENRDPRLAHIAYEGIWNPGAEHKTKTGFSLLKYMAPSTVATLTQPANDGADMVHIRYADVLLMYAEAKIEANDIDQSVLDAMNTVRARAYGTTITDTANYPEITTTDQAELRGRVRNERRVELCFENSRYFDLKRWKIAEKVLNGFPDVHTEIPRVFNLKHYKLPLPQEAIDRNPMLKQNPDY